MKTLSTKKLLIICLTLIFAVVTGLFATLCYRSAYAVGNPDGIAVYDGEGTEGEDPGENNNPGEGEDPGENNNPGEGEDPGENNNPGEGEDPGDNNNPGEGEDPGDNNNPGEGENPGTNRPGDENIAPPQLDDPVENPDPVIELITKVDKLVVRVIDWRRPVTPTSEAVIDVNPYGQYDADFVSKVTALMSNKDVISYSVWDMDGEPVEDLAKLPAGSTYFIHLDLNAKYKNSIEIEFAAGVERSLAGQIGFPDTETLEPFPKLSPLVFVHEYDGTPVNIKDKFLSGLMADKSEYLVIVESESDDFVQNGAGEFHYRIAFKTDAKLYWEGTSKDRSALDVIVTVKPMVIPTEGIDFGEIFYTGLKIDISDLIAGYEQFKGYVIGQKVSIGAENSGTVGENVGEYEVKLVIKPEFADSVKWEGAVDFVIAKWYILQTTISGEWDTYGQYGIMNIVSDIYKGGDGKAIKYTYTDLTTGEKVTKLDQVGHQYRVEVELINEENLKFTDDTQLWYEFTLEHEIVTLNKPVIDVTEQEFNGSDLTFKVTIDGIDITDAQFKDQIEIVLDEGDALTQREAGEYTVIIRLKEGVFWTTEEGGYFTNDERLTFTIKPTTLNVEWNYETGIPAYSSKYVGKDYTTIVKCVYTDELGNEVSLADMVVGGKYRATLTLLDSNNFTWKAGALTSIEFELKVLLEKIDVPDFDISFDFTGNIIKNYPAGWDDIKDKVEIVEGSFEQTNAGTYEVFVKVKTGFIWNGANGEGVYVAGDTVVFTFTINRAVLKGEWQDNGKVNFSGSFTGKYDDVVEYTYTDENGNVYHSVDELTEGVTYTASVKLKEGMENNFDASQLPADKLITYKADKEEGGIPWWVWLIIGAAVLLLIIIIIIIIIVKKRKKDDEYDDYYGDEYYGDEEGEGDDYGDEYGDDY